MAPTAAGGPVILDLQAVQSRDYAERGVARHALEFARALGAGRPDLLGAMVLNPDLPPPAALDSLRAAGRVVDGSEADDGGVRGGRIYHVIAPFEMEVGIDHVWPRWAAGMALVVTLHDLIPRLFPEHYHAEPGIRRRYLAREELVRAADRVVAVSAATKDDAVRFLSIDPARIRVIGAGISEAFRPPESRAEAFFRARASLPELEPGFLLYVGGIDHRKNVEGLLEAYARLPQELATRHQLVIAFQLPSDRRTELAACAGSLGIEDRLYLPGYIDDATLIAAYQATDLFVFPSRYEGYGLPVAEAMACGALCVSSDTSSVAELTAPEGQFDPEDAAAIAAVIARALTDPPTRAALEAASRRPPPRWAGAAAGAAEVYEELLEG